MEGKCNKKEGDQIEHIHSPNFLGYKRGRDITKVRVYDAILVSKLQNERLSWDIYSNAMIWNNTYSSTVGS